MLPAPLPPPTHPPTHPARIYLWVEREKNREKEFVATIDLNKKLNSLTYLLFALITIPWNETFFCFQTSFKFTVEHCVYSRVFWNTRSCWSMEYI